MRITWKPILAKPPFTLAANSQLEQPWFELPCDIPEGTTRIRIAAKGKWTPVAGASDCGPDGLTGRAFPDDQLLLADCGCGALIGRFGGSSAALKCQAPDLTNGESKPFAVGSLTVIKVPTDFVGPLFFALNLLRRPIAVSSLEININGGS
jgi:hypothetical protein